MNPQPRRLKSSTRRLIDAYDSAMLDLDGVVYVGGEAVTGVPALLEQVRRQGMTLAFVTNNAARPPSEVARHLNEIGVAAEPADVVTSAQAAAREVAALVPAGSRVLVVGGQGLVEALQQRGLRPVDSALDDPAAVVQGFHSAVGWSDLAEGAYAVQAGLPWVASNLDTTIPTGRGIAPGNGSLVDAIAAAAGRRPDVVAGKPFRPLFDETVRRISAGRPLVVGDRLDTDIEGAVTCGADSLLLMTGVTDVAALCRAEPGQRPDYVSWTMGGLLQAHPCPESQEGAEWRLRGWVATMQGDTVTVLEAGEDFDDGLRTVVATAWHARDEQPGRDIDTSRLGELRPPR